jgi:hypothetical protein
MARNLKLGVDISIANLSTYDNVKRGGRSHCALVCFESADCMRIFIYGIDRLREQLQFLEYIDHHDLLLVKSKFLFIQRLRKWYVPTNQNVITLFHASVEQKE